MDTDLAMAKKRKTKPGPKPAPAGQQRDEIVAVRCNAAWKAWLQRYADKERSYPTALIDKALAEMAQRSGFEEPPKR